MQHLKFPSVLVGVSVSEASTVADICCLDCSQVVSFKGAMQISGLG